MIPQGSTLVDTQYFTELTARINAIDACGDLQDAVNDCMATIQAQLDGLNEQLIAMAPMLALLELSLTDLPAVITFLEHYVEHVLTPYLQPYITFVAQVSAYVTAVTTLVAAIEAAAGRLTHCTITVPSITFPVIPT